jgi:hypothetical protein
MYTVYAYRENGKIIVTNYEGMKDISKKYCGKVDWNWINQFYYDSQYGNQKKYHTDGKYIFKIYFRKTKFYCTDSVKDVESISI